MSKVIKGLMFVWYLIAVCIGVLASIWVITVVHPEDVLKALTGGVTLGWALALVPAFFKRAYNFYNSNKIENTDYVGILTVQALSILVPLLFITMLDYHPLVAGSVGLFINTLGLTVVLANYR